MARQTRGKLKVSSERTTIYCSELNYSLSPQVVQLKTQRKLLELSRKRGVIYAGRSNNPRRRADQHEGKGYSGTLYYVKTKNMRKAENRLLMHRKYLHNKDRMSDRTGSVKEGYVYIIKGKRF